MGPRKGTTLLYGGEGGSSRSGCVTKRREETKMTGVETHAVVGVGVQVREDFTK